MKKLSNINQVHLPKTQIENVYHHLQEAGRNGVECVALWSGHFIENSIFEITSTIIPKQKGYKIEEGLLYTVDGEELHRINVWLYNNNQTLVSQIHSHPGLAYHSETDDAYPIVARVGGISIVIPDFAIGPFSMTDWAVYRLNDENQWIQLNQNQLNTLFKII